MTSLPHQITSQRAPYPAAVSPVFTSLGLRDSDPYPDASSDARLLPATEDDMITVGRAIDALKVLLEAARRNTADQLNNPACCANWMALASTIEGALVGLDEDLDSLIVADERERGE